MTREVRLSPHARGDFLRLIEFLATKNPRAARNAGDAIARSLRSLAESSERGREVAPGLREVPVGFGRDGYIVRYRVDGLGVFVTRIFHSREGR